MAKYQQYDEYKDSGVEWLGEIPKDWEMWKIAHAYLEIGSGTTPPSSNEEWYVGDIPWVTTGELREKLILDTKKKVSKKTIKAFPTLRVYPVGSIAIAMYGATIGRLGILGVEATTNQACCVMSQSNVIFNKFLYYWMQAFKDDIVRLSSGGGQPNINQETVASLKVSTPKYKEQVHIANFLDHETAQIDTLIEKQQTLIQLLKEKRQAVISHAVTKGLNPDAPMKDSGVEWLGEVPEHWSVIKLSNYAIPLNGDRGANYPSGNDFVDEGVFFISTSEVVDGYIKTDTASKITLKKYNQLGGLKIKKGDIIYCLRGSVGKSGICTFNEGTISSSLMGIRSVSIEPYYLKLLLASSSELQQRSMLVTGSVSANLSAQNVMGYRFAIPEKVEQLMIIAHVENSLEKIDILLSKATQAIQLMQERRIALISAAVTGKIDVRGWRASE